MRQFWLAATALALSGAFVAPAAAQSFDSITAFGDSLSDNGNVATQYHLPVARFTTNPGLTTVENVAQSFGLELDASLLGGTNYAYGGAGILNNIVGNVPKLPAQVSTYLATNPEIGAGALVSLWGGGNDVLFHAGRVGVSETRADADASLRAAAQTEVGLVGQLQAAGARTIIVFNVPDVGLAPAGSPLHTALAETFNAELNAQLNGREGVVPVNVFGLMQDLVADPGAYGFTNVTDAACTAPSSLFCTGATLATPDAASTYLFADGDHPTTGASAALASVVTSEIRAPGQMSLLAEAPFAVLHGQGAAVRDALAEPLERGGRAFLSGGYGERTFDGGAATVESESEDSIVTLGGLWRANEALTVGAAFSYGESELNVGEAVRFDATTALVSVFGQADWQSGAWLAARAGVGTIDYEDIARSFAIAAATRTEFSSTSGSVANVEIAGGRRFDLGAVRAGPFASLSYERVDVDGFEESGAGSTAMWFDDSARESLVGRLGADLSGNVSLGGVDWLPIARIAYAHEFDDDARSVRAGLVSMNGAFALPGFEASEDWGEAILGVGAVFGAVRLDLAYDGVFGGNVEQHAGRASVSLAF